MSKLNNFSRLNSQIIATVAREFGTPIYLYDQQLIVDKCQALLAMPHAYGLTVRYAMKANSNKTLLQIINAQGLKIDASSLNEVKRALAAGIDYSDIILTTQEVPAGEEMKELQAMMLKGLKYNACSLRQLENIGDFAASSKIALAMRIHPGVGSGESASRNTGDNYSCFGIHLSDLKTALQYAAEKGIVIDHMHVHIGSGADPEMWRQNIDLELKILAEHFPQAKTVSFGGGLKETRMPDEAAADIQALGEYATQKIKQFAQQTGRKLQMEIEPGTYVIANAGYIITQVMDLKRTGEDGFNFVLLKGGMELNARPALYGSQHPFYLVSPSGKLLFSEFDPTTPRDYPIIIVGRCCESGDSQTLTPDGQTTPRPMTKPKIGELMVIGGAGAYCAAMSPFNYNSQLQAAEVLFTGNQKLKLIRRAQTFDQLLTNEI